MASDTIPSGWPWTSVDDIKEPVGRSIVSGPFGSNIGSRFFVDSGVPVIRGSNLSIHATKFVEKEFVFLTEEKAAEFVNCEAVRGDLVFTAAGTIGQVGIIPDDSKFERYIISNKQLRARLDVTQALPLFVYYWLSSAEMVEYIKQRNTGSTVPLINLSVLRELPVPLPPLFQQQAIAYVLGSLDDRIELNRRMNATLEGMAQALFKSWFVDFDPVIDNALVAGHPIPEELTARAELRRTALDNGTANRETAKQFPDAFVETEELGWMPDGWDVKPLPEVVDFLEGPGIRNWQYTDDEDGIKFINIRCIQNGDLKLDTASKLTREEALGKYAHFQLAVDDIVISTSGTLGRYAFVRHRHLPLSLNTSVIRFKNVEGVSTLHFIAGYVDTQLQLELEMRATGSAQLNFGPMHLNQIVLLVPDFDLLATHNRIADEFFRKRQANLNSNDNLTKLRDTLLPKLISGELRIPDAEKLAEAALA